MKKLIYLFFATLTLTFAACQKDSDPISPSHFSTRIKTETYQGDVDVYSYDERGRIIHAAYSNGAFDTIQYYQGYYIEKEYDAQGNLNNLNHFELNADSLIAILTSTAQPEIENRYEYDDQKRVIKYTSIGPGDVFIGRYYYGPEGNQDSVVFTRNGQWVYTYENTFLEHQLNVYTKKSYGKMYSGEESKNMLAGTYCRYANTNQTNNFQYDYSFDAQGRMITMVERVNGISEQYDYTY